MLYEIFGDDENFKTKIIVDSALSCDLCDLYLSLLNGDDWYLWEKVYNWKNVKFIPDKVESNLCLADESPKIIVSSSGFCTNGRVVKYLQKYIADKNSMIIFSGYTGDNPSYLSYRIKNYRDRKTISINKKQIPNRADCMTMSSISSHASNADLVKYGSNLLTNRLILVHGSVEAKNCLAEKLRDEISKNNKTYKVQCSIKDMVIHL